jgi:DNA segregation ATPase FtsK/SpoIIIE, S-DNA-T family
MGGVGMPDSTPSNSWDEVVTAGLVAVGAITVGAVVALWWSVRHPRLSLAIGTPVTVLFLFGPAAAAGVLVLAIGVAMAWRRGHRASFDWFFLGSWRRTWIYSWHWRKATTMAGLGDTYREPNAGVELQTGADSHLVRRFAPKLGRVRSDRWCDRVSVPLLDGQHPGMYEDRAQHLAHAFGALACRVECPRPGRVILVFQRRDALATVVPALPVDSAPDLRALSVGVLEDGRPWTVAAAGSHLLIAGATGSGKGSVIWSLIRAMAPRVHEGTVQLWCVDPKGGMELAAGAAMFTQFAYDDPAGMADLLDDAVDQLHERAQRMRCEGCRKHTPSLVEPHVVVIVDELAFVTAYMPDRDLRKRITNALSILLSKGRAVGFTVVAALQDPRKEVAPIRDLFPVRVALRLTEAEQSRIVLGPGAHDRGAECERIPVALPGVGYVVLDGTPAPVRVRASWVTDDDIAAMADRYPARRGDVIDVTVVEATGPLVEVTAVDLVPATESAA